MEGPSRETTTTPSSSSSSTTTISTQSSSGDTSTKKMVSWASIASKKVDNNNNDNNNNNNNNHNNNNTNHNTEQKPPNTQKSGNTTQPSEKKGSQSQPSPSSSSSSSQKEPKVKNLIVDANVFIKHVRLESYGETIWTIPEVLEEVRDKTSRDFITFLPYEIKTKSPTPFSTQAVVEFSKKTGDFPALSATDLKLIALVHTLELEVHGNVNHLRTTPPERKIKPPKEERESLKNTEKQEQGKEQQKSQEGNAVNSSLKTTEVASSDSKIEKENDLTLRDENEIEVIVQSEDVHDEDSDEGEDDSEGEQGEKGGDNNNEIVVHDKVESVEGSLSKLSISEPKKSKKKEPQHDDDEDEAGYEPWITPDNISQMKQQHDSNTKTTKIKKEIKVGCLTADYAMQNVMLSMGLKVISVDGLLIKKTKQFVLRCIGCFTVCTDMEKAFCPACGNNTLARVAKIVDWSGAVIYTKFSRKSLSKRGTKYSIPSYKGGRHAHNIILNEEAYLKAVQSRPAPKSGNLLDPDAEAALGVKRHNKPVVVGYGQRNPNASKKRIGKKNKPIVNR